MTLFMGLLDILFSRSSAPKGEVIEITAPVAEATTPVIEDKKDNSYAGAPAIFGSSYPTYRVNVLDYLNTSSLSYNVTLSLGNQNAVISAFIGLVSGALQKLSVVDDDDNEIQGSIANKLLEEAYAIFGHKRSMRQYVYNTINQFICTGMKISAPIEVNEDGEAVKVIVLDGRKLAIMKTKSGEKVYYGGKELQSYEKFIVKPSLNRSGYGDCIFAGAVKDAILGQGIIDTAIAFYDNNADPSTIHILGGENVQITKEIGEDYERKLKEKYQGIGKNGLPFASNILKDVKVIDASNGVVKSIDQRLYTSKTLAMQLNVDIRALGRMRDGGSQAEMTEVYNQVNTIIDNRNELLSESFTNEFNELVADTGKYRFKFIPKYYSSKQQKIKNCFEAKKSGMNIDEKWALDLIYNS